MTGSDNLKSFWLLVVLAIFVLSLCHDHKVSADDCEGDLRGFDIECMYYINKGDPTIINPNDRCCNVIKQANIPCCCNNLNRKVVYPPGATYADLISWPRLLHCLSFCGKPLSPGTKCGSFTVPPGPPPK